MEGKKRSTAAVWLGNHFVHIVLLLVVMTTATLYAKSHSALRYFTLRGVIVYWSEGMQYERLLDAAAFSRPSKRREAVAELNRRVRPTAVLFATEHPEYVRSEAKVGELQRREDAYLPPLP